MAKPFFRSSIPRNSKFNIKVSSTGAKDAFTAAAVLTLPDLTKITRNNQQLRAGVQQTLSAEGVYSGEVDLTFAQQSTARIQMEVVKTDGSRFVYDASVTRSSGLDRANILLVVD